MNKYAVLVSAVVVLFTATCEASPANKASTQDAERVLYDQKQEGHWNVRADLKNFVILLLATQPSASASSPANVNLLDFLTKSNRQQHPQRNHPNNVHNAKKTDDDISLETKHFIESKTAPYHVDITETKLEKLHDDAEGDAVISNTPTVRLVKTGRSLSWLRPLIRSKRLSRAFVFTVPADEEFVLKKQGSEYKKPLRKEQMKKKAYKDVPKSELKLLGADLEQCGPGMARDSYGNCKLYKL